jgi:hypothetical protein
MVDALFTTQRLAGRDAQLQQVSQILTKDDDFLLVGASGIGRRSLIRAAAAQVGARVLEIDCLRTTSAHRFLRLLADSITEIFASPNQLAFIQQWSRHQPLVLEQHLSQRPQLVWTAGREWIVFQTLLALPQLLAEWLNCRVVIMFINFPHIRSWDRTGKWEDYLRQEIQEQSRVSYALVTNAIEPWAQQSNLHIVSLPPLEDEILRQWIQTAMAAEQFQFDPESGALDLFVSIVQGHSGDAITLARRLWLERLADEQHQNQWQIPKLEKSHLLKADLAAHLIEAHHVYRSTLAVVADLSNVFESLILLLPPSQVRVLESLALDPTDKPQSREYIQKHQLTRGGGLQGALASLEQKGLVYGPQYGYRIALPFLGFWLKQRLS